MKKEDEVLARIKRDFTYVSDPDQYEHRDAWFVMKPKMALKHDFKGDCEDFALTVLFYLGDCKWYKFWWNLITRKAKICYCTVNGVGHAVLKYKGLYADNIQKEWNMKAGLENKGYKFSSWLYIPYQVALKMLVGKFQK